MFSTSDCSDYIAQKILLAEDELELRSIYQELLEGAGFQVETAEDGEIALKKMRTESYDLVLLDIMMPKISGLIS